MKKKAAYMGRPASMILLLASLCMVLASCKKVDVDLASDFVDNSTTNIVLVDSSTVQLATVYVDSFATSATGCLLAGRYSDVQFGNISAESYIQLGTPPAFTMPAGAVFDSLEAVLTLNKTYYGDTLAPYSIAIHQLTDPIKLPNEQTAFYNIDKWSYDAIPLGTARFTIRPSITDTIAIPLSPSLGQALFDKIVSADGTVTNNDLFADYFKGLAITGGDGNNLIMGFRDSMTMRLHYRNPGVITTGAHVDFSIYNRTNQFNNITVNRTGTPIANLGPAKRQILSSESQHAGFSQYISGAVAKISFPYLMDLLGLNDFVRLIRADLIIKPVSNSFQGFYALPPALRLSQTDQYNVPGADIIASSTTIGASGVQYGNLFIDNLYGTGTAYTYDITSYLQQQIANKNVNNSGLLIWPPNATQIFNRVLIGDKLNKQSQSQVKIYYATVK